MMWALITPAFEIGPETVKKDEAGMKLVPHSLLLLLLLLLLLSPLLLRLFGSLPFDSPLFFLLVFPFFSPFWSTTDKWKNLSSPPPPPPPSDIPSCPPLSTSFHQKRDRETKMSTLERTSSQESVEEPQQQLDSEPEKVTFEKVCLPPLSPPVPRCRHHLSPPVTFCHLLPPLLIQDM